MKIVIDIPENEYEWIKRASRQTTPLNRFCVKAIANGIPLPKGHGRIGDLDSIMNDISNSINEMTNIGISIDGQYLWAKLNDAIDNAPTIIEADKER